MAHRSPTLVSVVVALLNPSTSQLELVEVLPIEAKFVSKE